MKAALYLAVGALACSDRLTHDARDFTSGQQDCIAMGDGWQLTWASEPRPDDRHGKCAFLPERVRKALGSGDDPNCIHIGPDTCTVQWDRRPDGSRLPPP